MFARLCGAHLLLFLSTVSAVYDPLVRHTVENFDPAEANPAHRIKCFGDRLEVRLPVFPSWNPNTYTVQQLCAKPQYGGMAPHRHLGGYCAGTATAGYASPSHGLVAFDRSLMARTSTDIWNMELLLYCRMRCFCLSDLVDEAQPKYITDWDGAAFGSSRQGREDQTYQIKMENFEVYGTIKSHRGTTGHVVPRTAIWELREINAWRSKQPREPFTQVSIAPGNPPICTGPLPEFPLPGGYQKSDFADNQAFCAVQLGGGNPSANAGMYCHRRSPETYEAGGPSRYLWFSDWMTPRPDWTLDNLYASLTIRYHCNVHCKCPEPLDTNKRPDTTAVDVIEWDSADQDLRLKYGLTVVGQPDGSLVIFGAHGMSTTIYPKQRPGEPVVAGTCGEDGRQFCPVAWPEDLYGPKPLSPPLPRYNGRPIRPSAPRIRYCGNSCSSAADCSNNPTDSPAPGEHCSCMVPHTTLQLQAARSRGEDAVFPKAFCGVLGAFAISSLAGKLPGYNTGGGILGGRSVDPDADTEAGSGVGGGDGSLFEHACVCNATYVSSACCDSSKNGMIWEDRFLKLGVLQPVDGQAPIDEPISL